MVIGQLWFAVPAQYIYGDEGMMWVWGWGRGGRCEVPSWTGGPCLDTFIVYQNLSSLTATETVSKAIIF